MDDNEARPVIDLCDIGRRFDTEPPVDALRHVNLTVLKGEWVAIIGPSGSGKSTLLNVLGCLDRATSGTYHFDGTDVGSLTDKQRAGLRSRGIGFVFQSFHLLAHRSVLENVMMAEVYRKSSSQGRAERAQQALDKVGVGHRAHFMPTRLSGGERQRVAIARALVGEPSVLLCDEPTGNLDSITTETIMGLFEDLNRNGAIEGTSAGITIVMITHEHDVAARAKRQVRIVDGLLTEVDLHDLADLTIGGA